MSCFAQRALAEGAVERLRGGAWPSTWLLRGACSSTRHTCYTCSGWLPQVMHIPAGCVRCAVQYRCSIQQARQRNRNSILLCMQWQHSAAALALAEQEQAGGGVIGVHGSDTYAYTYVWIVPHNALYS